MGTSMPSEMWVREAWSFSYSSGVHVLNGSSALIASLGLAWIAGVLRAMGALAHCLKGSC